MKQYKFNSFTHLLLCVIVLLTTLVPSAAMAQSRTVDAKRAEIPRIPKGISSQDGRLIFDNADTFSHFMKNITNQSDEVLNSLEEQLGFHSMRRYAAEQTPTKRQVEQAGKEGIDEDYWMIVPDPYLATVLNPQGILQIGEDVHRVTREALYTANVRNRKALQTLSGMQPSNLETQDGVEKSILIFSITSDSCDNRDGRYRLKGKSWIFNSIFYSAAGSSSKFQKRHWPGFWMTYNADELELYSDYSLGVSGTWISNFFHTNPIDEDVVRKILASDTIGSGGTWNNPNIRGEIISKHTAERGNKHFECWTYVYR